jgi:hypothetical protein
LREYRIKIPKRSTGYLPVIVIALCLLIGCAPVGSIPYKPVVIDTLAYEAPEPVRDRTASLPEYARKMELTIDETPLRLHNSEYYYPTPLLGTINTAGFEELPYIAPDGSILYYFFTPGGKKSEQDTCFDTVTGTWSAGVGEGGIFNDPEFVASDNYRLPDSTLYLNTIVPQFYLNTVSPMSQYEHSENALSNLPDIHNLGNGVGGWCLSPDGNSLYFHAERSDGTGGSDIWAMGKIDGEWQEPENIAEVNTEVDESYPFITYNGKELWFSRENRGMPALFRSVKNGGTWSKPFAVITGYAIAPTLDNYGNLYFTHFYTSGGEQIESDIFVSYKKKECG